MNASQRSDGADLCLTRTGVDSKRERAWAKRRLVERPSRRQGGSAMASVLSPDDESATPGITGCAACRGGITETGRSRSAHNHHQRHPGLAHCSQSRPPPSRLPLNARPAPSLTRVMPELESDLHGTAVGEADYYRAPRQVSLAPWNGEVHVEKNSAPERGSPSICRPATWSFASMICCRRCWGADATFGTGRTTAAAAAASIAFPGAGPLEVGETSVPRQPVPPRDFLTILPSATRGPSHVAGFQCIPSSSTRSTHALVASCHGVLLVPIGLSCRIYPTTNHTKLERQPASASS
ncbi:hypothetical protein Purlil1_7221 [Purpureocillium lilacinum]|uniref:Uncharacterized protein n=1 Tax=Purpureocillium lilacinum TaxID=33203 RepID=A0ABR0BWG9_PURLI|nr:hypothetical protein Purlil1_7221 [Purpureocillium lilacinum]